MSQSWRPWNSAGASVADVVDPGEGIGTREWSSPSAAVLRASPQKSRAVFVVASPWRCGEEESEVHV